MPLFILNGDEFKEIEVPTPFPPTYTVRYIDRIVKVGDEATLNELVPIETLVFERKDDYFLGTRYICENKNYEVFYIDGKPVILKVKQLTKAVG